MSSGNTATRINRSWLFGISGLCLGISAPIGWQVLRLLLFWQEGQGLWAQVKGDILRSGESLALFLYMGAGTAVVLGVTGFLIGRGAQQVLERALSLDKLNRVVAEQKESFERRFRDLNKSIKNFHSINTHIQKSVNVEEILRLAANGLHEILGYDRVNILMVTANRDGFDFMASRGCGGDSVPGVTLPLDERSGALYKAVVEKRIILVDDITQMPDDFHLKPPCSELSQLRSKNFVLCPIIVRDEVAGLFAVDNKTKKKQLDDTDVDTVKLFADQVASSLNKLNLLEAVESLTGELEHTFAEFSKNRKEHSRLDASLKEATESTAEAIVDISSAADVVREAVDATRSAAGEISVSIDQVSSNLVQLSDFMENSVSAMTEISATIKSVEESGARSHEMSEAVKAKAESGVRAVVGVISGLQGISEAVEDAVKTINRLSQKGEEINTITTVISEVTQKTNLLALNAAIIAAQAGEHGRSFGVVAEEVRDLSQETAQSTGAITRIIEELQEYTRESVAHITKTRKLVQEGMGLGTGMEQSLSQILASAGTAMDMTHDIRSATQEVARSVESITSSIEKVGDMSSQITTASSEQADGTRNIVQSIEEVKNMADDMALATERQKRNTLNIEVAVTSVSDMVKRIFDEMEQRREASNKVIEDLRRLKG
ncbi:methyl-accepting chemotaxis protein [Trichloromonas sp.]|uniref:methyl-accepting chemotaxis protein n=1 Tax=Trichloromonas sp. TaxID=3069249 RepID=UPI003D8197CB